MKKKPSNLAMNHLFDQLAAVKAVDAPEGLYARVLQQAALRRQNMTPLVWVRAAAAVILLCGTAELLLAFRQKAPHPEKAMEALVILPDNALYHE